MLRIMLLLCYSLIDTNTIPFYFSLSQIGRADPRTQRFGLTVSFRRFPSSFCESYRMGRSSTSASLMPQLVQVVIRPQHGAFVDSKGLGNLLRISYVSLTNLHILRDVFVGLKRFSEPFEV